MIEITNNRQRYICPTDPSHNEFMRTKTTYITAMCDEKGKVDYATEEESWGGGDYEKVQCCICHQYAVKEPAVNPDDNNFSFMATFESKEKQDEES